MEMKVDVLERVLVTKDRIGHADRNDVGLLVQGVSLTDCRRQAYDKLQKRVGDGYTIRQVAFKSSEELEAIIEAVGGPARPQGVHANVRLPKTQGPRF